ncbi:MAG: hypothetical protein Q8P19_01740 [bacterium]|nr:hypothetical protein [bacterium]
MSEGIQFENQGEEFGTPPQKSGFDLASRMVSWGLVSSRKEAEYAMIGVAALALLIAAFFFFRGVGGGSVPPPPPVSSISISILS